MTITKTTKPEEYYLDREMESIRSSGMMEYRNSRLPIWCPGCGFYGIETAIQEALNDLKIQTKDLCIVSGIGCTGRYPFFSKCYGLHVLHGRTLPVATGAKTARPDLTVLAIAGDGDCMGIGAGHFPHAARRNPDITLVLFDNNIYGLTKGQTSPTTPLQQKTNSHPFGNPDKPIDPIRMALAAGATYVARGFAGQPKDLAVLVREAILHKGFSLVHAMSPCLTFDSTNYTYENLRKWVMPLPKRHDFADLNMAMNRALDKELFVGLFYKTDRPTLADEMAAYADRGAKK